MRRIRRLFAYTAVFTSSAVLAACGTGSGAAAPGARGVDAGLRSHVTTGNVLLVGTYLGVKGQYKTIQSAVNAAKAGDWILVAPGDYHERDDLAHPAAAVAGAGAGDMGGVLISTPDLHLRGMSRSGVIVDGTKASAPHACDSAAQYQQRGPKNAQGQHIGRNGILVWKANGVSVDNLTVCNFLSGAGDSGNEVWWDGGAGSGKIGLHRYWGSYLTATSTFFKGEKSAAAYGIFANDAAGPATWNQIYANNMNDSGMYVGACLQACNITINHAWMENNALGYSGTNSGGAIVVKNSQFDHNEDGFDTNTQLEGDPPAPQDGRCPGGAISPITHTRSCWVFMHNNVHDNNNPNTPKAGSAAAGPTGTGMTLSGGRFDTVMDNKFSNNGAWGILFVPYPGGTAASLNQTCSGTGGVMISGFGCVYEAEGDALLHNTFSHNGYFGNPSNSDFGQITIAGGKPVNCYAGNTYPDGSAPSNLETIQPKCSGLSKGPNTGGPLFAQVLCDTGFGSCPAGAKYPQQTAITLTSVPKTLPTMADPCVGVPANPWCPSSASGASHTYGAQRPQPQHNKNAAALAGPGLSDRARPAGVIG